MKEWLKILVSDNNEVSHKRVISLLSFIILLLLTIIYIFKPTLYNQTVYITYASLALGESLLSRIKLFK